MLARLLRWIGLVGALGVAGWVGWCFRQGLGLGATLGPVLALLGLNALALALEQAMAAAVHGQDPAPRPSVAARCRAWARELWSSTLAFGWAMPFASQRWPDTPTGAGTGLAPDLVTTTRPSFSTMVACCPWSKTVQPKTATNEAMAG